MKEHQLQRKATEPAGTNRKSENKAAPAKSTPVAEPAGKSGFHADFSQLPLTTATGIQAKLTVGQPNDRFEREADRVADAVVNGATASVSGTDGGDQIRRKCAACGAGSGTCSACAGEEELQRKPLPSISPVGSNTWPQAKQGGAEVSAGTSSSIQSLGSGQPLPAQSRGFFESGFGREFSDVRLHTGGNAARAADGVGARAFTLGNDIVMGVGQYAPETSAGRHLLAHELTHVVQQGGTRNTVQRVGFLENVARFFGGGTFDEAELQTYLETLQSTGQIEDNFDSDNKARAIVMAWRNGGSPYILTAGLRALMIQEMQSGFTGNDDEQAILELLERSYNFELTIIFGTVGATSLNSDFHGGEWARLQDFYSRRFEGGMSAVLAGTITPKGDAIPLGTALPPIAQAANQQLPGADLSWNEACILSTLCPLDSAMVAQLGTTITIKVADQLWWDDPFYDGSSWTTQRVDGLGFSQKSAALIGILGTTDCPTATNTIVHEIRHQNQAPGSTRDVEFDAYRFTEEWLIQRGIPGEPDFRTTDPLTGDTVVDTAGITAHVLTYPGPTTGPSPDEVIGHNALGQTELERANGTTYFRAPRLGDSHPGPTNAPGLRTLDASHWQCP